MPELPEVQTTVNGLREHVVGLRIIDVWSDYGSKYFEGSETIKDPVYFRYFKKQIIGKKIVSVDRRAKNILIRLSKVQGRTLDLETLLVHLKMTGHLLYGHYHFNTKNKKDPWEAIEPESLKDSKNRHIHFVITFSNNKHLALSDVRKFAKVTLIESHKPHDSLHLKMLGPEPLEESFTFDKFVSRINLKKKWKIKQVIMDQSIIAGIGNIYADESLWLAGIHPATIVMNISSENTKKLFEAIKHTLSMGIDFGGDSMSDYRNIHGNKGEFQENHHAYRRAGRKCDKRGCGGTIQRVILAGRSTHFCNKHQKLSV